MKNLCDDHERGHPTRRGTPPCRPIDSRINKQITVIQTAGAGADVANNFKFIAVNSLDELCYFFIIKTTAPVKK
jgi:hypothetical protein